MTEADEIWQRMKEAVESRDAESVENALADLDNLSWRDWKAGQGTDPK